MSNSGVGLQFKNVSKAFDGAEVLKDITFSVGNGEVVALTGPSGAGKTTVCRMISGIDHPSSGDVYIGGELSNTVPAQKRGAAHMFESFALYPHMNVFQNVAFPLRGSAAWASKGDAEIRARVESQLELTEIAHLQNRLPSQLSGGQKQRVALCRALVQEARAYVLDEPISHLDAKLRNRLRGDIRRKLIETGRPSLWCTPDAMDAIAVADRIVVLLGGKIAQIATPDELFHHPASTEVAALVGDPPMNILSGSLGAEGGRLSLSVAGANVKLPAEIASSLQQLTKSPDIKVGIPPTAVKLAERPGPGTMPGKVYTWEPFGKHVILTLKVEGGVLKIKAPHIAELPFNAEVFVEFDPGSLLFFNFDSGTLIRTPDK